MKTLNKTFWPLLSMLTVIALSVIFVSCGDDGEDPPVDPALNSLTAGDVDLNGATSPNNVAADATITAVFNTDIDAATANSTNITLMRDYDDSNVDVTVSTSGSTVTVTPSELISGALYELKFGTGIMSTDAKPVQGFNRTFTTAGTFTPAGQVAYWNFEDNAEDQIGSHNPSADGMVDITFTDSRNANAGKAATFDGDASLIEIPDAADLVTADNFTLSFWMKTDSEGHVDADGNPAGYFVMGLAAYYGIQCEIPGTFSSIKIPNWIELSDGTSRGGGDLYWPGDGKTKDNEGWQGTTFNDEEDISALIKDKWTQIVEVFDGPGKLRTLYVNGEKRLVMDYSLWPEDATERLVTGMTYGGAEPDVLPELAFGFVQSRGGTLWDTEPWGNYEVSTSNHFKGQLDDVRIFHTALSAQEVDLMYNSEK